MSRNKIEKFMKKLYRQKTFVTQTSGFCEDTFSRLNKEEIEMRSWKEFENKSSPTIVGSE